MNPDRFTFTRMIPMQEVYGRLTVAEADHLERARAIALGRELGARQVVLGRIWNLRSDTNTDRWSASIWHEVSEQDTSGKERKSWIAVPFRAVSRFRTVHVEAEFEVVDTDDEQVLDHHAERLELGAHTVWSDRRVEGDPDDYRLCEPSLEKAHPDDARRIRDRWDEQFAPWSLSELIEHARRASPRSEYLRHQRPLFSRGYGGAIVYMDDLPPAEDLAALALADVWQPMLESLARLDPR